MSSDIIDSILHLKAQRRAILLAHNYQRPEVQDIADFIGDSLELSRKAATIDCDVIVFCGVHFMAESASILSPDKIVLLPELNAGCPMADMVTVSERRRVKEHFKGYVEQPVYQFPHEFTLRDMKTKYPGVPVVAYVNTTAAVKAESDICCTSANVIDVVNSMDSDIIISVPDKNLSMWAQRHSNKRIITWDGFCNVHDRITKTDVVQARATYPNAILIAHPECPLEVLELADHVASTSGMIRFCKASDQREFIIATETGILHRLKKDSPEKLFHPLRSDMVCPNMKMTTLNSVLKALQEMKNIVKVDEEIRIKAKTALDRMLSIK